MESIMKKVGLVLEGGGMRGAFTMGVLDYFEDHNIRFPLAVGVSAGASNGCSYISGQRGRNIKIATSYISDHRYLSWRNFFKNGSLFGMDFGFRTIPNELNVFDFEAFYSSKTRLFIGTTNCLDGRAVFFDSSRLQPKQFTEVLISSCSLPILGNINYYQNTPYLDGGIAASIPIDFCLQNDISHNVVILTREKGYFKKKPAAISRNFIKIYYNKYPALAQALINRADNYNASLATVHRLAENNAVFIIQPPEKLPGGRTEKDPDTLHQMYQIGYRQAERSAAALLGWMDKL